DEVVQEAGGESARPAPPLFREDLRQDGRRHVLPAAVVDHPDLLAGADPVGEFVEGDVPALAGVVELAAPVAFDEAGHGRRAGSAALTHRGKAGFRAASIHATSASASRISGMSMHAGCALPDLIPSGCFAPHSGSPRRPGVPMGRARQLPSSSRTGPGPQLLAGYSASAPETASAA